MDYAALAILISAAGSLAVVAEKLRTLIEKASKAPDVVIRVVLYLETVQTSVYALGLERQLILQNTRQCDIEDKQQVEALWARLDTYLHVDHVRPHLRESIEGLDACREELWSTSHKQWWRDQDTVRAVENFNDGLVELESMLGGLVDDFYPGGSGTGVTTLVPLYELISDVRRAARLAYISPALRRKYDNRLAKLAQAALTDPSNEAWLLYGAKVERLAVGLELAFQRSVTKGQ